ncbi:hypothetical protein GCM10023223_15870 [Stackebrandtia albiflava]
MARTGCTVVLFPEETTASAEVRGGAPATRELALLAPHRTVAHVDAAVLTGGSAFGLASADGVMRYCEERGRGVVTPAGPVPIVPALGLFDLTVGDASVRPGPEQGYAACLAATGEPFQAGRIGAGTGATVGKLRGPEGTRPAGLGIATVATDAAAVTAIVAVNAVGDVDHDGDGMAAVLEIPPRRQFGNTVIGIVVTDARLDKTGCLLVAQGSHDGLARTISPPHTTADGDAFIAAATGRREADVDVVRATAVVAVSRAIRAAADSG